GETAGERAFGSEVMPAAALAPVGAKREKANGLRLFSRCSMPRHMPADFSEIRLTGAHLVDQPSAEDDDDSISKFKQLVEILADEKDGGTAIAYSHDFSMNLSHGRKVKPETRVGRDHNVHLAAELAGEHRALDIAAGEFADRRVGRPRPDLVAFDLA